MKSKDYVIDKNTSRYRIVLTKEEVNNLKEFCDENLAVGYVIIDQTGISGVGTFTCVQVKDLPDITADITDREYL